jgi:BirA family biotin operon repressor/biotin-[acetyl-CoA-carboxylase] ligase
MTNDIKSFILNGLKKSNDYVSGNKLAAELSISRVALWKHIKALKEAGYRIESNHKGYKLTSGPDLLLPFEFGKWSNRIHYFDEISSTMDMGKNLLKDNNDFTIVVAEKQTKGRGRFDRFWYSHKGGIYFTYSMKPNIPITYVSKIVLLFAVAIADTLNELFNVDAKIKWPNDIIINNKKVCGILTEMTAELDKIKQINVGIGINVNNEINKKIENAISLKEVLDQHIDRKVLFKKLLENIENELSKVKSDSVLDKYKHLLSTLNKRVSIKTIDDNIVGTAIDISPDGALLVQTDNGDIKKIISGDCVHLSSTKN